MDPSVANSANSSDKMRQELQCPICLKLPESTPIYQCKSGHLICKDCAPKLNHCGVCRVRLQPSIRSLIAEKMFTEFEVKCKFQKNGCDTESMMQTIFAHEKECLYRTIECEDLGFGFCNTPQHEKENCNGEFVLKRVLKHLERCHKNELSKSNLIRSSKIKLKAKVLNENGCVLKNKPFPSVLLRVNAILSRNTFVMMFGLNKDGLLSGSIYYVGRVDFDKRYPFNAEKADDYKYEVILQNPEENKVSLCKYFKII